MGKRLQNLPPLGQVIADEVTCADFHASLTRVSIFAHTPTRYESNLLTMTYQRISLNLNGFCKPLRFTQSVFIFSRKYMILTQISQISRRQVASPLLSAYRRVFSSGWQLRAALNQSHRDD